MERTWEDLQRAALTDAFLHRCLHWEREAGRERALINTCMALAEDRERLMGRLRKFYAESTTIVLSTEP